MLLSDTAILVILPFFVVELIAPTAEEDISYGNYNKEYCAKYRQRILEHSFCGINVFDFFLAAHFNIPLLIIALTQHLMRERRRSFQP